MFLIRLKDRCADGAVFQWLGSMIVDRTVVAPHVEGFAVEFILMELLLDCY